MKKLDTLDWVASMAFVSHGVRIGIRTNAPQALQQIDACLPPRRKPMNSLIVDRLYSLILGKPSLSSRIRHFNLFYGDHTQLARSLTVSDLLIAFEADLQRYVAEHAHRRLFVHAGVVGWQGQAIVIPGRSMSGKTTLVAEFVRAGATYYSDEYAVFDARGRVHPYPKWLSVRDGLDGRANNYPVEHFGGQAGDAPLPVGMILVSEYRARAQWRPQRLSPGHGALALVAHTIAARSKPAQMLPIFRQIVTRAPVLKSARGEARHVVDSILNKYSSWR
ncbi:MAG: hypothetical protein HY868_02625 [Chloroflexi bacterium]|nr:hypothetical protein [Chloroflexota bacterium]